MEDIIFTWSYVAIGGEEIRKVGLGYGCEDMGNVKFKNVRR